MINDRPTYSVRVTEMDGVIQYYAAFIDGSGIRQEIEIGREIYLALEDCRKHEQRQTRSDERHTEQSLLSDEQLVERSTVSPTPLDEAISLTLDLQSVLPLLTESQRRRFLLYHEHGLSYQQIASIEGCSARAVEYSVAAAKAHLKKFFEG